MSLDSTSILASGRLEWQPTANNGSRQGRWQMDSKPSHSAEVQLLLEVQGRTHSLSHLGPDYVRLRTPVAIPPCNAEIIMRIEGHEQRWRVRLPDGAVPFETKVYAPTIDN